MKLLVLRRMQEEVSWAYIYIQMKNLLSITLLESLKAGAGCEPIRKSYKELNLPVTGDPGASIPRPPFPITAPPGALPLITNTLPLLNSLTQNSSVTHRHTSSQQYLDVNICYLSLNP